jgi:hypothetical protein
LAFILSNTSFFGYCLYEEGLLEKYYWVFDILAAGAVVVAASMTVIIMRKRTTITLTTSEPIILLVRPAVSMQIVLLFLDSAL